MKIVNCTPHAVNIIGSLLYAEPYLDMTGVMHTFAPSGTCPRVEQTTEAVDTVNGIPIVSMSFGEVCDLPPAEDDTIFIVSRMVIAACPSREDLLCPGELVRDEEGRIIGCKNLSR